VLLDVVERPDMLQDLIGTADLVVSLLPNTLHYLVAEACINAGVHLVTASYCTNELKEMHDRYVTDLCKNLFYTVRWDYGKKRKTVKN
jgi:alpha-aminoadipic semialdehyde synthase